MSTTAHSLFLDDGSSMSYPSRVVVFGPHADLGLFPRGVYTVHLQPSLYAPGTMTSGNVFALEDIMRPAVMDDFGALAGVPA